MSMETLVWLIPLPPLISFTIIILFLGRQKAASHWVAAGAAGLSWIFAMLVFVFAIQKPDLAKFPINSSFGWLPLGKEMFNVGIQIDPLSTVVVFFVAWTILMIFIYSVGYHNYGQPVGTHDQPGLPPHGAEITHHHETHRVPSIEPMYARFFAFISLFAFAMYTLVVTDNLLVLYVGWEIMGLCSYLLIGFWFAKPTARDAAVKAFLTTRIGDMFMLLGIAALYSLTGTLNYREILSNPAVLGKLASSASPIAALSWAGLIGLLIFMGTVGKSAQFPLHVWLPDAMEGPTPVSAMIHAATMVSAGVYLVIRFYPLMAAGRLDGGQTAPMVAMALIGAFTAIFAATIALTQSDIKRVLAYSTISQLGFMIAALGVGAYVAAVFHLVMHAFFKALLFLGSGSVIHGMEHGALHSGDEVDTQDMFHMGGLVKKMPLTFWTFLAGGLSLAGFPFITAGFWSKDEILSGAFGGGFMAVFITLAVAAFITAFYTMRQVTLVFLGKPRTKAAESASETSLVMTIPLIVLAVFAIAAGWSAGWFKPFVGSMLAEGAVETTGSWVPLATSLFVSLVGLLSGWLLYRGYEAQQPDPLKAIIGPFYTLFKNKYWIDEFYEKAFIRPAVWVADVLVSRWIDKVVIDGILNWIGRLGMVLGRFLRFVIDLPVINKGFEFVFGQTPGMFGGELKRTQTGRVQEYIFMAMIVVILVGIVVILVVPI